MWNEYRISSAASGDARGPCPPVRCRAAAAKQVPAFGHYSGRRQAVRVSGRCKLRQDCSRQPTGLPCRTPVSVSVPMNAVGSNPAPVTMPEIATISASAQAFAPHSTSARGHDVGGGNIEHKSQDRDFIRKCRQEWRTPKSFTPRLPAPRYLKNRESRRSRAPSPEGSSRVQCQTMPPPAHGRNALLTPSETVTAPLIGPA